MDTAADSARDLATMVVPRVGRLVATGDPWDPYRLLGPDGTAVDAVSVFFADLEAAGRSAATLRSYGMDLLRWFRFLWATGVPWLSLIHISEPTRRTPISYAVFCL